MISKKDALIRELKQLLINGEKVYYENDWEIPLTETTKQRIISTTNYSFNDNYLKFEDGFIYKYQDDKQIKKLDIKTVADILDKIAEKKIAEQNELEAVSIFLNS